MMLVSVQAMTFARKDISVWSILSAETWRTELSVAAEMASEPFERTMPTVKVMPCAQALHFCINCCGMSLSIHTCQRDRRIQYHQLDVWHVDQLK